MSLCQKCKLKIKLLFFCSLCRNQFCSCNCLINHINSKHSSKLISGKNYIIQNPLDNLKKSSYNNYGYIINLKPYILTKEEFNLFEILKSNNNDYQIGSGAFSKVYLGKHKPTNELYAIKKISLNELNSKTDSIEIINREIELHSKLYHKNITHLVATYQNEENIYIILEYLNKGDLYKLIKKKKNNDEETCFKYFIQILSAVLFLHENNLIHRDIKPENILINDKEETKLCDFGCCVESRIGNRTTFCGTYEYMAPEIIKETSYNNSVDVWSLGILLYELSHGYTPFNMNYNGRKNQENIFKDIIRGSIDFKKGMNFISDEYNELMVRMIVYNPNKRIKLRDVFKSKLITKFENKIYLERRKSISRKSTIDKSDQENKNKKNLSERQEKKHSKQWSNDINDVNNIKESRHNTVNSSIRKTKTKIDREDSLYTKLKKNKKIDLGIKNVSIKNSDLNQIEKLNKQYSKYKSYLTHKINVQNINLYDNNESIEPTFNKSNIKKNDKILSNNKSNSSANIIQINISNPNNYSHKYLIQKGLGKFYEKYLTNNKEVKIFDNVLNSQNNEEDRKTKMRNINGANISSKLIDVIDIFNTVEKLKRTNQNLEYFQKIFQRNNNT